MKTTAAPEPEIVRHSGFVRAIHWLVALCFIVAMATGFALYWASILSWMYPFFGGKNSSIAIHLLSGIGLALFCLPLFVRWRRRMRWSAADTTFIRNVKDHGLRPDQLPPPGTGFFNGGQKIFFWTIVISTVLFFGTGLVWWWRYEVPQGVYVVCRTSHRILGVIISAAFFIHLYKATIGEPGTLGSMLKGTVSAEWARMRRPQWFRDRGDLE
jgi:formate dehydrogenase subunit gamma